MYGFNSIYILKINTKLSSFKVLLKIVFNSDVTYEPVSDDPLFHRLNDGKDIWGIKFFNKESSEEFRSRIISIISEYKTSDKSNNTSTPPPQIKVPPKKAPIKKMPLVSKNPPPLPKISSQAKTTPNNSRCVHQNSLRKIPKGFVSQQQHILYAFIFTLFVRFDD